MGVVVSYLYKNNYIKRYGRMIEEDKLREKVREDFESIFSDLDFKEEFYITINTLAKLSVIEILDGKIWLIKEVNI